MSDISSASAALPSLSGRVPLSHLGVVRVAGADAMSFLQGQITQDVALLGSDAARLAAYCNPKGRMQASFVVVKRSAEQLLLVGRRDALPALVKRLSMFVLRAQAKLTDVTQEFQLWGLAGTAAPQPAAAPWSRHDTDGAHTVALYPGAGQALGLWLGTADAAPPPGDDLPLPSWHWLVVRSGVVLVGQPCFEAFVPQMLNYESVGGVNFKKGCYPGQEVVARSQFRGTLKRRAYVVHAEGALAEGQEVFHSSDAEQPCGLVAAAAPCPDGQGWDAIVSMQVSSAQDTAGRLHAQSLQGPALSVLPLPYPLREDI